MKATIINIGDEILIGQIVNTNATWMAEKLNQSGIAVDRVLAIADTEKAIKEALDIALLNSKLIFITGGLGPTKDDITKKALAHYFEMEMAFHEPTFSNMQQLFAQYGKVVDDRYQVQAEMPVGAKIMINKAGTASGMWFEKNGSIVVAMPGVPREVKYLMTYEVLPNLKMQLEFPTIIHQTLNVTGKGETDLAEMLEDFEQKLPSNIKLAYLPNSMIGMVRLRLSAYGEDAIVLETQLDHYIRKLPPILGSLIFGEGKDTLEGVVGQMLLKRGYNLGTAESCTGGNIAHKITSVAGCSAYYESSVIAYSNAIKQDLLGVHTTTLEEHGAVSEQTVIEMARGTQKLLNVNCSIAVSGIAGPTGGSPEKPVGTIWIAVTENEKIYTKKLQLGKDRLQNIERTTTIALNLLRRFLLNDLS
ncbi:CinA family nicotinamide mononucleotide deamidase-related protein [Aureispira anguillae]|uniref:CinA-like protein n=1 Tax=Aureispira anguillae TaxID=2864201 RepID=A0A915YKX1_9BACT|nr:CinA family nicotinamide mononucleotide deamidase-related protein [Aureispira anguillae]BDS14899.1 CinA family nicotinamide mononucleotide deamidase-related protein [Aureispira anguillae]